MTTADRLARADAVIEAILASERRRERQRRGQPEPTPIEAITTTPATAAPRAATGEPSPSQGNS